jgi:hypothetical protein
VGRPLWREVGCIVFSCCWVLSAESFSGPSPAGLTTIFFCLNIETLQSRRSKLLYDWRSVSQCLAIEHPCGTCNQILLPVGMLLSEICGLVSVGRPFWREDGSAICSVIAQWPESLRARNHTLLSHLRLPQPGRPGSRIYITQKQGGPVLPPDILRLSGLRWKYYNSPSIR